MRQVRANGREYVDLDGGEFRGAANYYAVAVPEDAVAVGTIANGANANRDFNFASLGMPSGYYQVSVAVITEMADATWRELRFAFSLYWDESTIVLQGVPTAITGAWNSAGLAGTISVVTATTLRVNLANTSGQATAGNGEVYLAYGRRSPAA